MDEQNLKDILTQKAIERVEGTREDTKPDFNNLGDLDEKTMRGRKTKTARGGKVALRIKGRKPSDALHNLGLKKSELKQRTRKTKKTKKRRGTNKAGKQARINVKTKKSKKKLRR